MNARQKDTVIAALSFWAARKFPSGRKEFLGYAEAIACANGLPLDAKEIQALIAELDPARPNPMEEGFPR